MNQQPPSPTKEEKGPIKRRKVSSAKPNVIHASVTDFPSIVQYHTGPPPGHLLRPGDKRALPSSVGYTRSLSDHSHSIASTTTFDFIDSSIVGTDITGLIPRSILCPSPGIMPPIPAGVFSDYSHSSGEIFNPIPSSSTSNPASAVSPSPPSLFGQPIFTSSQVVQQQGEFEAKLNLGTFPHSSAFKIYEASEIEAKQNLEKSNHLQKDKIKLNMHTFPYYRTVKSFGLPGKAKEKLEERVPLEEYFPFEYSSGNSLPETSDVKESNAEMEEKAGHADDGYESLPEQVKMSLLYCSLFPSHYEFRKDELIQMWMAEGFIHEFHGVKMEDIGGSYFNFLHKKGFLVHSRCDFRVDFDSVLSIPIYNPGKFLYKVNHMKLAGQQKTIPTVNCFVAEDAKFDGAFELTQHLSLICKDMDDMTFGVLTKFKHLCTLLLLSGCGSSIKHVPRDLFMRLKNLRTLNLSQTLISELPSSIRNAKSLRYLDLSNTPITRLPESIDSLQSLQTIKLRGCIHFLQLPKGMKKLINLRHINLDITRQLRSMPPHLGKLTHLQSLSAFLVGQEDGCRIGELNNLNALTGVLRISRLENVLSKEEAEEAALIDKKCLQRLELRWSNVFTEKADEQEKILECLQPHAGLKELQIQQFAGSALPTWISNPSLAELVILTLYRCKNCDFLPSIGQLPMLKSLSIIEMNEVKEIDHQFFRDGQFDQMSHAFPKLEILEVDIMLNLKKWNEVSSGDFPSLLKLTVDSCLELDTFPSLSGLKSLKYLEFRRCPKLLSLPFYGLPTSLESFIVIECPELKEWCLKAEDEDWICHVPSIWLDCEEGSRKERSFPSIEVSVQSDNSQSMEPTKVQTQNQSQNQNANNFQRPPDDGYKWRKYGQKQVKGSEYPRMYYRCTHPNCPVRKKVERSHEGHITEIIYQGDHNHSIRLPTNDEDEDEDDQGTHGNVSLAYDVEGDESESKRRLLLTSFCLWKTEAYATEMSGATSVILEPSLVIQTTSDIDDGYSWRKYAQKDIIGHSYPRSYYRCNDRYILGCKITKQVERASHDPRSVITTYRGKHNHDISAASVQKKDIPAASVQKKDIPAACNSSHVNSGPSGNMSVQASGSAAQTHPHQPEPSQDSTCTN